ncbi:hypothetical protein JXB28_05110 [Candidatus Woesearchaeota archaeon]|nr:hypothetical protein [Candidatus Woesearchaeota archaeon]
MVKGELDYNMWLVAIVACVAVLGVASVIGDFQAYSSSANGITAYVISEPEPELKAIAKDVLREEPEELPEPLPEPAYVYIIPDVQSVKTGDEFIISVNVAGVSNLYAFHFDIAYDPEVLELVNNQAGAWFSSNGEDSAYCLPQKASPGLLENIVCTRLGNKDGLSGKGVLETLTFKAIKKGESPIALQNAKLSDPDSGMILLSTINGRVNVK